MYLIDTNVLLELLLEQEEADQAEQFLRAIPGQQLYISEFALYSIGIILFLQSAVLCTCGLVSPHRACIRETRV